jgi:hypothetical protein
VGRLGARNLTEIDYTSHNYLRPPRS